MIRSFLPRSLVESMMQDRSQRYSGSDAPIAGFQRACCELEPCVDHLTCRSLTSNSYSCGTMPGEVFVHRNIAAVRLLASPSCTRVLKTFEQCFHPGDTSATAVLAYAINTLGVTVRIHRSRRVTTRSRLTVQNIVVVSHYGCGGIHAAMGMAKSRSHAHMNNDSPSAPLPGADDELGQGAIERWLAPTRALAVAQLRAAGPTGDLDDEESHRQLVRTHCCAQVSNIESSAIVQRAEKDGKKVNVYGWCVGFSKCLFCAFEF